MTDRIKDAAFSAWQCVRWTEFDLVMAQVHGNPQRLRDVRSELVRAMATIDAALAQEEGAKE